MSDEYTFTANEKGIGNLELIKELGNYESYDEAISASITIAARLLILANDGYDIKATSKDGNNILKVGMPQIKK